MKFVLFYFIPDSFIFYLLIFFRVHISLIEREYHPPEDDERKRALQWNQYVSPGSPNRSMTMDVS